MNPEHDPNWCGKEWPGKPPRCPACLQAAQAQDGKLTRWERMADEVMLALGLPRRQRLLNRTERREIFLRLLDLSETCQRDPEFAAALRKLFRDLLMDVPYRTQEPGIRSQGPAWDN